MCPMDSDHLLLNVAATCVGTHALGPGYRSAVWVQGCIFTCPGCISPNWIPQRTARLVSPQDLCGELLEDKNVTGLTISGGEPMLQAEGLACLVELARIKKDIDVICFTGYKMDELRLMSANLGVPRFLRQIDVLIDGQYIQELNDDLGLRGSSNQVIHYLTPRLVDVNFETNPRHTEIRIMDGEMLFVGVPPKGVVSNVVKEVNQLSWKRSHRRYNHERS